MATGRYTCWVKTTDTLIEALKEWVTAANPGFVTRDDLLRVEGKLDDLLKLVDALEARVKRQADATGGGKRPRRHP